MRLRILHAVQQDHTYANAMPTHLSGAESVKGSVGGVNAQAVAGGTHMQMGKAGATANSTIHSGATTQSHLQTALASNSVGGAQQWSLGGIGATVAAAAGQTGLSNMLPTPPSSGQSSYTLHGQQIPRMQQDDDAHSAISNGSRVATGDIDPGEETETAPEAEAEDDSVTRCICDLTHDDGYMICCDKCSVWQHVDCMGIDRQNIPDEYQCEVCQPRPVDKARARSLQLMKRKEQTQLLLSAQSAHATGSTGAYLGGASGAANLSGANYQLPDGQQRHLVGSNANSFLLGSGSEGNIHGLPNNTPLVTTKKGKVLKKTAKDAASGKKSKKADKLAALGGKPPRKDSTGTKKTTKRKTKSGDGLSASATAAEKHAANLRQWIENYELAVTNHYSPELRARLHAITKQPSLLQSILNTENRALKEYCNNGLENRGTTVPHAGGKILISNMDIAPSCPIFELRGKYMLSPQYKTQNASVNMNSPPPSNFLAATLKAHKTPGPFIFFYQLPDAEAPMQTMNQDGSYPPLPPQPAYLKGPEICVDTRTYGNEARFVRRSCRPNAEIQHLFEKGTIHLFIVATTRIRASTEITIKHEPHDLLAIENKKTTASNCIVQPTSTACACGLLKDCLFGPPPTQQSLGAGGATKSSSRKSSLSTTLNGGVQLNSSAAAMQLTMGGLPAGSNKKKSAAQNINRNRSTSSSGDSSIGATVAPGMNSPSIALPPAQLNMNAANSLSNSTYKSNGGLNILSTHALAASAAVPNSNGNMSATSSVSSVMHDSGICTSSSSPSVSIPSPTTLHMHSPTPQTQSQQPQQQPQQQQQPVPTAAGVQRGSNGALFVQHSPQQQQQHQQILGALPTPLLLSPSQQLSQLPQQQQQSQAVLANSTSAPLLQEVTSAETATPTALTPVSGQTQPQTNLLTQQTQQEQQVLHSELAGPTISDASLAAAAALQSLNTAVTLTSSCAPLVSSVAINNNNNVVVVTPEIATPSVVDTADVDQQQPQQQQQTQFYVATEMQSAQQQDIVDGVSMQAATLQQQQQTQTLTTVELPPPSQTHAPLGAVSPNAGPKSPQKHSNNATNAAYVSANSARSHKIPGAKSSSSRSTSFSEDDHQQQQHNASSGSLNDDTVVTPTSKEKPKLSREDRKMEAILRAIEKMERNQQRKNQTKSGGGSASSGATKRRNSNSNSPTTPTKRSMGELSSSSGRVSAANARKKKRKAHKSYSGHSAQARKRRKSRMNSSNESADGAGHSNINVHSEAESTSLLSPAAPLVPTASIYHAEHNDTAVTTNEDQAAGLLLAFANPNLKMSPTPQQSPQAVASPTAQQQQQQYAPHYALEQLKSPQHRAATSVGNGASPPATPVSSACLLIEAAVGPLQEHMDGASPSGEFKYPNKTKTKKVLMSNWLLNQVDADNSGSDSPPPAAPTPPPPSVMNSSGADAVVPQETALPSGAMLGLDSLVQAATMCDYRKQHNEADSASYMPNETHCGAPMSVDEPENLSMAAQKVEEFIQQTERGNSGVYNAATNAGAPQGTSRSLLHLPLQVSTCSNNSSVKKRWLRQAISEETTTDESMTPTSTAAAMAAGLQHAASPTTAAAAAAQLNAVLNVPNGFTTPLKKRRLIISGDMKEEEDVGGSSAASPAPGVNNLFESPVIGLVKAEPQTKAPSAEHGTPSESMLTTATSSDAEVDVLNVNSSEAPRTCIKNEAETSDEEEIDEEEDDAEEERDDVDVVGGVGVNELQTSAATTTIAHVTNKCLKQEVSTKEELLLEESEQQQPAADELKTEAMLIDQDDDVDILRSPSPGHQQMLAAEDNLVKIEPEDTSGGDDVKIDVEREESLAGDKFEEMVLMQVKKEESTSEVTERLVTNNTHTDEAKVNVAEAEKLIKPLLIEENATAADEKPYKQLFNALECVEKVESPKKEEQTATSTASKPKVETQPTSNTVETAHHSAVNEERISTTPTKTSPLKLLSLDGTSLISPDEPLKKRLKLETSTVETSSTPMEVQQTSLLKPLSARIHEMPKQSENNDIVPPTTTAATTAPIALAKPTAALKVENAANNVSATAAAQPNCMTFLAAAAAAAIERKPPPPPPVTTATTPIATQSTATTASAPANTNNTQSIAAVAPAVNAINSEVASGNVSVNNVTASLPNSGNVSTALAPRKQNATNNNNSNERKAPLTDDDIQARLHSFHKENILFLQSRNNKKSKPNVTTATTTIGGGNTNELVGKSAKLSENKTSATTNYTSHHSHHHTHAHNDTVKSVGSSSNKHSSTTKSFGNSSSGSSSSTKKLHKRDRNGKEHSSSSSRSSSAHSGKLSSSSSTKKVSSSSSSSHKKDYVSGKSSSGSTTPVPSSKQQTHSSASSSYNNTNNSVAGDNKERADERRERDNNREQRSFDKERHHHRHRTTSSSNVNNTVTQSQTPAVASSTTTPTPPPPPASKKRQLNFEQELTKDLPLVNAVTSSSSRHRKDSGSRDSRDDMLSSSCSSSSNSSLAARKRRESSSSSGGGSRHRHNSGSSCGGGVGVGAEQQKDALAAHKSAVAEHKGILAGAHVAPLPPPTYVREHVAIPHFNNVVVSGPPPPLMAAYFSGISAVPGSSVDAPIATYVPTPALPPSSGSAPQTPHNHSLLKTLPMQPVLSHLAAAVHMQPTLPTLSSSSTGGNVAVLPPPTATVAPPAMHSPGAAASLLPCNSASANSTASTYNSIYGKLRDTSPVIVPPTLSAVTAALAVPAVTPVTGGIVGKTAAATAAPAGVSANISLSEYLDTKVKSYSTTLGGYVTPAHTYVGAAGGSGTPNVPSKTTTNNTVSTSVASVENITTVSTPLESPVASKLPTPLKLPLTRTASHDPRLNPQLNAPEPPPAPKRKLSINEYRKRMQLSTDSTTPSTPEPPAAVSSTATTPAAHMTPASLNNSFVQAYNSIVNASPEEMARQLSASPTTLTLNKYTLNSPERKRRHSGSEKEQRHSVSYEDASGLLNSSTGSSSSCGNASDTSLTNLNHEDDGRKGQFSAAPTLLEKQQEKLCERLKLLRNMKKGVASLSSAASEFANLKKDCDLYVNRTNSISSTDNLDNCLEEISSSSSSSSSTSRASSREASPEHSGVVSSSSNASVCKRATSTTGSNHKWLHEPETTTKSARGDTPTRDDVLLAATASRCGSESAT
uniref:Histone-lysine N-methyltransferase MLL5 n=1 Tax=Zeugodacus cucurbitae TaxID=28588 RepID=A0A0A1WLK0_ZEUCU